MVMVWWYVMPEVCSAWTKRRTAPSEDRTHDFQIMRLALYRLSYRSSCNLGILFLFWPFHLMTVGVPTNRRKGTFHDMWRTDNSLNSVANPSVRLSLTNAFVDAEKHDMGARCQKVLAFPLFSCFSHLACQCCIIISTMITTGGMQGNKTAIAIDRCRLP